jgi:hypothetical protein
MVPNILVAEIALQIINHVIDYNPRRLERRHKELESQSASTLVALACTSRMLSEIAVRIIWETIPHLGVVMALLPEDSRRINSERYYRRPNDPFACWDTKYTLVSWRYLH